MDLSGVSKKGVKLINDNPDLSPYELLEKGLSQKDYEKIAGQQVSKIADTAPVDTKPAATEPAPVAVPKKVEVTSNKPVAVEKPTNFIGQTSNAATFKNKKTGKIGRMNAVQLDILCRRYPQEFEKL